MSNNEVESKIIEVDREALLPGIIEIGAKKVFDGEMTAVWLFCKEINKKIRVRLEGNEVATEYKIMGKKSDSPFKKAEEIGFKSNDFEGQINFFTSLGFVQISRSVKHRISYLLNDKETGEIKLEFDKYSNLDGLSIPELLELEGSEEGIIKFAKILGFNQSDLKDWTAKDLLDYYKNKQTK